MFLVRANNDLDRRKRFSQCLLVLYFEWAEGFYAVSEVNSIDAEFCERPDALEEFSRSGQGRAAGAVNDTDEIQRLRGGIPGERALSLS